MYPLEVLATLKSFVFEKTFIAIKSGPKKFTIFLGTYAQVYSFLTYRFIEGVH